MYLVIFFTPLFPKIVELQQASSLWYYRKVFQCAIPRGLKFLSSSFSPGKSVLCGAVQPTPQLHTVHTHYKQISEQPQCRSFSERAYFYVLLHRAGDAAAPFQSKKELYYCTMSEEKECRLSKRVSFSSIYRTQGRCSERFWLKVSINLDKVCFKSMQLVFIFIQNLYSSIYWKRILK